MTNWEYGFLSVQSGRHGVLSLGGGDPQRLGILDRQQVLGLLNDAGADGWELVGTEVVGTADATAHTVFWLKRERR